MYKLGASPQIHQNMPVEWTYLCRLCRTPFNSQKALQCHVGNKLDCWAALKVQKTKREVKIARQNVSVPTESLEDDPPMDWNADRWTIGTLFVMWLVNFKSPEENQIGHPKTVPRVALSAQILDSHMWKRYLMKSYTQRHTQIPRGCRMEK